MIEVFINSFGINDSNILERCRQPEVAELILDSIAIRRQTILDLDPKDPLTDTQFILDDLQALQRPFLPPEGDDLYTIYRLTTERDMSRITNIIHQENLNPSGRVVVGRNNTTLNPVHSLEIVEKIPEERRGRSPEEMAMKVPKRTLSIYDVHLYRAPNGEIRRRPTVGFIINVYADEAVEIVQTRIEESGRVFHDPESLKTTASNHPAAKILMQE